MYAKKKVLSSLKYSLSHEFFLNNNLGSYFNTSFIGCNANRRQGLLVCRTENGDYVLLSSMNEVIMQNKNEYDLGVYTYPGKNEHQGLNYLHDIKVLPLPTAIYRMGPISFKKEMLLLNYEDTLLIRYTLLETSQPVVMELKPFLAMRSSAALNQELKNLRVETVKNGIVVSPGDRVPSLFIQGSNDFSILHHTSFHHGVEYIHDNNQNERSLDVLLMPCSFRIKLYPGKPFITSASTSCKEPASLFSLFYDNLRLKQLNHQLKVSKERRIFPAMN